MKAGLTLPQSRIFDLQRDVFRVARAAEDAGFASLWAYERVLFPVNPSQGMYGIEGLPWIEHYEYCADPLTVLTLAGAVTRKAGLGTSVLTAPLHGTLGLARALATLDQATGGRVVAGLGGGWSVDEFRAAGVAYGTRGTAFDEAINGLRAMFGPNPVSYRDSRISIDNALVNPKPVTQIPIVIGGGGSERALRRIAAKGDGWFPVNMPGPVIAKTWQRIQDLAADAGRDPGELRVIALAMVCLSGQPRGAGREPFQGTLGQIVEDIAGVQDSGACEIVMEINQFAASCDEVIDQARLLIDALVSANVVERA